ncbi:hypothetical protein MUK42_36911 [Musa troglodytarum]|uniref:Uncharacterized protein n=1 Tax=Musa troglodytarum TaxID=320322 RepID=A0A9E7EFL3_9LILI|nr:hypothetical protein MUK42_36911 [Musa troglodytarum]
MPSTPFRSTGAFSCAMEMVMQRFSISPTPSFCPAYILPLSSEIRFGEHNYTSIPFPLSSLVVCWKGVGWMVLSWSLGHGRQRRVTRELESDEAAAAGTDLRQS